MSRNPISEENVNPTILKDDFSSSADPFIFTSIESLLLHQSNETSWNQQATSYPSPQCLVDRIQVQKPIQVVATHQIPDHISLGDQQFYYLQGVICNLQ